MEEACFEAARIYYMRGGVGSVSVTLKVRVTETYEISLGQVW